LHCSPCTPRLASVSPHRRVCRRAMSEEMKKGKEKKRKKN
jgi:hypothetical protein